MIPRILRLYNVTKAGSRLAPLHDPRLIACAPFQMDEAFVLDAFAVEIFFEATGGDKE